ncbi:tectonic protein [Chloropicon primus]|nr:tectonic protein [Chloropicon primus]
MRRGRSSSSSAGRGAALVLLLLVAVASAENSSSGRRLAQALYTTSLGGYKVFESYPTDWTAVDAAPQARTVQVNDIGACYCDLTANACDTNCCCDADCGAEDKALFTGCLPEAPNRPQLTYCVPKSVVQTVNLQSSGSLAVVYKTTPKKDFFSELLCVEKDNNPAFGNFFMDPGAGSSDRLTDVLSRNPGATYKTSVLGSQQAVSFESSYKANETIAVAYTTSTGTSEPKYAALSLPVAVFGDECREVELVGFLASVPEDARQNSRACLRKTRSLSTDCFAESPFLSAQYYVGGLNVATTPAKSSYVAVTVSKVSTLDSDTGAITTSGSKTVGATSYDAVSTTCSNVLKSLKYTIKHNGNGVISAVEAEVLLTNVKAQAADLASLEQEFSVVFEREGVTQSARGKSGNPGYRVNYPVLFGVDTTDAGTQKSAVSQFLAGLPMISMGAHGECSTQHTRPLPYGSQSMGSCKMNFFREQLKKFCQKDISGFVVPAVPSYCPVSESQDISRAISVRHQQLLSEATTPLPIKLLSGLFGSTAMSGTYAGNKAYVGIWGDSSPSNTADWIEFEVESIDDGMSWNEQESTCSKVVSGIQYEFLTANVGSQQNPQQKVTYARVKFTYDDWTFSNPSLDACPQPFNVYSSASFVEMDQEVDENVKPPAPPVFPKLPEDAFYPFLTN